MSIDIIRQFAGSLQQLGSTGSTGEVDTHIVHVNDRELGYLKKLNDGYGINPYTGLMEFAPGEGKNQGSGRSDTGGHGPGNTGGDRGVGDKSKGKDGDVKGRPGEKPVDQGSLIDNAMRTGGFTTVNPKGKPGSRGPTVQHDDPSLGDFHQRPFDERQMTMDALAGMQDDAADVGNTTVEDIGNFFASWMGVSELDPTLADALARVDDAVASGAPVDDKAMWGLDLGQIIADMGSIVTGLPIGSMYNITKNLTGWQGVNVELGTDVFGGTSGATPAGQAAAASGKKETTRGFEGNENKTTGGRESNTTSTQTTQSSSGGKSNTQANLDPNKTKIPIDFIDLLTKDLFEQLAFPKMQAPMPFQIDMRPHQQLMKSIEQFRG